ncbi:hypothetical protein BS47DRAFT_1367649 [Hydnum rufescens UP504]|uniref:HECT-type E3 ubiquitin transferase n=1 Tax=Hydnum rufescens UP504 TaxID=1448309 RepID=A0A9P6AHM6_9AGAM|nr:hypothetical protein BS47DRAFT_1367649 [Hydnum rufescens UP504]
MILERRITLPDPESMDVDLFHDMTWLLGKDTVNIIFETFTVSEGHSNGMVTVKLKSGGANIPATEENNKGNIEIIIECHAKHRAHEEFNASLPGSGELTPQEFTNALNERDPNSPLVDWTESIDYQEYERNNEIFPWFWQVIRSRVVERESRLLQFTTGTS